MGFSQEKRSGVAATVVSDGAAVYERPDFDSKVIAFIPFQTQVMISHKAYAGADGLGLFHKARVHGKIGYIPDTDVRVAEKERVERADSPAKIKVAPEKKSMAWDKEEDEGLSRAPPYLTRFLGGALARVNFTEKFSGHKLSDEILMYGMRMTGPGTLFDGPPLDLNFWFSMQKPKYYDIFSTNLNGFLLFGDVMPLFPIVNHDQWVVDIGLGLMWTFTKYRLQIRGENTDSLEFRIGVDLGVGVGHRFGKRWLARADAKYYIERSYYPGLLFSLQTEY